MQTEANSEESEIFDSELNTIKKLKNEEMKKKSSFVPPKGEPRDDDQSLPEIPSKKSLPVTSTNGDKNDDLNGVLDISGTFSDDDSENFTKPNEKPVSNSFKKEELTEVKILDEPEEMLINEDDDLFSNGSNEQFSFNLNSNDQSQGEFLDDDNVENPLAECESDVFGNEITEAGTNEENETNDSPGDANDDEDESSVRKDNEDNDGCDDNLQNAESNENLSEDRESNADEDGNSKSETSANISESNDSVEAEKNEARTHDEADKDAELDTQDSKRPSSRESTTSTTSSCSERTLTIRSASDLNKLVMSANDALVKKEKVSQEYSDVEQVPEKHHGGLSILNPSQLGASISGGENLLQNVNFAQPNEQMNVMGYMQNSTVPLQCDVCETQFPDNITLEEHKANAGHYKCHVAPDCAALIFQSLAEVSNHQQTVHNVLQQLTHQVQTLPIRYEMGPMNSNYSSIAQFQSTSPQSSRPTGPQVYPPAQNNMQMRGYVQPQPRLQIGAVRGNVAMPIQTNATLKRSSTTLPQPRMTPPKRGRLDYSRNGDTDCKVVSIQKPDNTDDVVAQLSKSITITARQDSQKKNDTAAVTNLLANRGITVSSVPTKQNRNSSAVTALSLNSAVSLIPTNGAGNRQGRTNSARPAAPVNAGRLQTVDLTGPDPPRNRQLNRNNRFQCQICDRNFFNQDQLNQHMITHRNVARKQLPFKCNLCTAQYPTQQGLQQHKQTFHRDSVSSTNEMVIPIVDLKQPGSLQKLNAIGIHHMIPLNALGSQSANGTFGIPVLPLSSDRNVTNNLANCAITNILPVGPLKTLGR